MNPREKRVAKKYFAFYRCAILFPVLVFLASCNKTPVANFDMDKTEYLAGETVLLTNQSDYAHSYLWTFPDAQTSDARNVKYILHPNSSPGVYTIQLKVFSKKKDKSAVKIKNFTIR